MEIMLTKPPAPTGKPDLRVIRLEPQVRNRIETMPTPQPQAQPTEMLDRRQVRLRWD